jgi:DNA primase
MAFISKTTIQEVNTRMDAISIVGDYVRLEKKGGRWWGRCPFHGGGQEKTPSFKVDPDLKTYYCFGCNKGGSVLDFVMEMDRLTYPEAIKNIAAKTGVEIVYEEGSSNDERGDSSVKEQLYELYDRATVTLRHFLKEKEEGKAALKYLEERGISAEMIESFKLGFAPCDRDFLHKFLKQKGYSDDFLERSGLFSQKYKKMSLFSGRLMFPITDRQGRVVAFGGRAMPGAIQSDGKEPPKYINSPETDIYKKGQTLYAIEHAKETMRQTKTAYIAEGYMDVIALHQAGVRSAVAPLGTAFTDEQAVWLRRWVEKAVLVFDNDEAGLKAAYKAILTCRKNGLSCALVDRDNALKTETGTSDPSEFKDPAEILQKFGPEILNKVMNYTINDFEYLISLGISQIGLEGGVNRAAEFVFPYIDCLNSEVEREDRITRLADIIRIDSNAVHKDFYSWKKDSSSRAATTGGTKNEEAPPLTVRRNAELILLTVVAVNMELYPDFRSALEIREIDDAAAKELFIALEECFKYGESGIDSLLSRIKDEALRKFILSNGDSPEFKEGPAFNSRKFMEDGINSFIKVKRLKKRSLEIGAALRNSERSSGDMIELDELLEEKMKIDAQIKELEGK